MAKHKYTAKRRKRNGGRVHVLPAGSMNYPTYSKPKIVGGDGPKLQGGLPPKVRDNSKAFNSYAPVWGVRCAPHVIGATTGSGLIIKKRVTNGR